LILSCYNFTIAYILRKENERVDALSQREQDMPKDVDNKVKYYIIQLLKPSILKNLLRGSIIAALVQVVVQQEDANNTTNSEPFALETL
jgi:hypothetical protein